MRRLIAGLSAIALMALASPSYGSFVVAGELQTEQGDILDWDPFFSSLIMSDIGGGVHSVTAVNLLNATTYDFKVVDDQGSPPAEWGDPEITPNQLTLLGDADGAATIVVDTNLTNNQGNFVTWVNFDDAPLQVVGDFMNEAGGAGDWNPADPAFTMTSHGNGYYTYDMIVSTAGNYNYKVTFGNGWDDQIGTDGFNNNANTLGFIVAGANEPVTLYVDMVARQIGAVTVEHPFGTFTVAGDLQTEQGDAADWDVANSSLVMAESGGVHSVAVNNLANGTPYDFKVYNDEGTPPVSPGDPQITPYNITLFGDADGKATITVDTNVTNLQGNPAVWADFDTAPLQVVGDFMNEAGGAGDWNPADPAFAMTAEGDGYYTFDAVISTPGIYQFKASFGAGWGDQVGTDGFSDNATTFGFQTTEINEAITMFVDLKNRLLGLASATLQGDLDGDGFVGIADLNIVLGNWNQNVTPGDPLVGDPSGDGFVGIEDLNEVLGNWNAGTPPAGAAVPEPATLALMGAGGMGLIRRRH